jgi:UDP-3-O-[3-hydroxymyristoyl] glucosamine N-acyltransferase
VQLYGLETIRTGSGMKLSEVADALGGTLHGDGALEVKRVVHPSEATDRSDLALALEGTMLQALADSLARAAVVGEGADVPEGKVDGYISVGRARVAMSRLLEIFDAPVNTADGIHPSAVIEPDAVIGARVRIGPFVYVGKNATVGSGTTLMSHIAVGADARIGSGCLLHAGVRIGERVVIGDRAIIQQNASIGADGFSFVTPTLGSAEAARTGITNSVDVQNTAILRINSVGTVEIGDDVEIGACSSIDRGTVSATRIGSGTKIDDLVMIGHNVEIGENCMLCGQVGIAGSSRIGNRVVLAGKVGVADHITVGDDVVVGAGAGVINDLPSGMIAVGTPAVAKSEAFETQMNLRRIGRLMRDLAGVKKRLRSIESNGETG